MKAPPSCGVFPFLENLTLQPRRPVADTLGRCPVRGAARPKLRTPQKMNELLRSPKVRFKRALPPVPAFLAEDALLTAAEAAAYRRQGLSTFWRDVRNGTAPAPVRLMPKTPRWRLADLRPGKAAA